MVNSWVNLSLYWNVYVAPWKLFELQWAQKTPSFIYTYLSFPPIVPCFFLILLSLVNSPLEIENLQHGWEDTHNACFLYLSCAILFHMMTRKVELLQVTLHWDYGIVPGGNDDGKNWVWNIHKQLHKGWVWTLLHICANSIRN